MKPTPQISSQRSASAPLTDYNYQSTLDASYTGAKEKSGVHRRDGFWRLSTKFHGGEALRNDATDFLVFTLMALLCVWPIVSLAIAVVRNVGNY